MKCTYHPEVDAVGACANCGRLICVDCQTILMGKSYCNPCASKLFKAGIGAGIGGQVEVMEELESPNRKEKPLRRKVVNRVLKVLGWVLVITFSINVVYSFLAIAGTKHSISEIAWQIVYSALMIWLGAWLISRKEKPTQAPEGVKLKKLSPSNLVLRRGKTLGGVLLGFPLMLLYLIPAGLFVALLGFAAEWFYGKDWWILGAIFRIGEWVVGIGLALYFLVFFIMWLVMLVRIILGLEKELDEE